MKLFLQIQFRKNLDLFTFYDVAFAINIPETVWFESVCSSLKRKHSVFILEAEIPDPPMIDETKRWVVGDNYCWLSPRSLSVILQAYPQGPMNFHEFKEFLKTYK